MADFSPKTRSSKMYKKVSKTAAEVTSGKDKGAYKVYKQLKEADARKRKK